jgi:hypothetical protein
MGRKQAKETGAEKASNVVAKVPAPAPHFDSTAVKKRNVEDSTTRQKLDVTEQVQSEKDIADISRDLEGWCPLYVHHATLHCASKTLCIPCLYKLSPTGQFGKIKCAPNQRPEACPRSFGPTGSPGTGAAYQGLYHLDMQQSVLTVGDGDLSFSLSIARGVAAACALSGPSSSKKHATGVAGSVFQLTATTHESLQSLLATYTDAADNIAALIALGVTVLHDIDATHLAASSLAKHRFDVIVWNFPCVGIPPVMRPAKVATGSDTSAITGDRDESVTVLETGKDGQVEELEQNVQLLKKFFENAPLHLTQTGKSGEVHVTHKTIEPFNWWNIPAINANSTSGLVVTGSVVFDRCLYPGYINRKVLHRKSFPSHDAHTYIFKLPNASTSASADAIQPACVQAGHVLPLLPGSPVMQELARAATAATVSASAGSGRSGGISGHKRSRLQQQRPQGKKHRTR